MKVPRFSRKGEYLWDAYVAPPEPAHLLMSFSDEADLGEARRLFLAANILSRELTGGLSKKELLEALSRVGVPEEEIKLVINILYEEGITSRYNESGEPESPAFLILDEERAKEEIQEIVKKVEDTILS